MQSTFTAYSKGLPSKIKQKMKKKEREIQENKINEKKKLEK